MNLIVSDIKPLNPHTMLLKIKKVKTEEEVVELKLPAFFRNPGQWFYMITEEQTVIRLSEIYEGIAIRTFTTDHVLNGELIKDATQSEEITPYEFFKQWHLSMDHLQKEMQQSLLTK